MKYKIWNPIDGLEEGFNLEGFHDDYEGIRLLLKSEKSERMLRIHFDIILSYRNIDDGNYLKSTGTEEFCSCFNTVENSSYLKWFKEESYSEEDKRKIIHYAIYTSNDCVDILSHFIPKVEWLND